MKGWFNNGDENDKKAIIPAAGYGTRRLPITKIIPKEMFPIGVNRQSIILGKKQQLRGLKSLEIAGER